MSEKVRALVPLAMAFALAVVLVVVAGCSGQSDQQQGGQQQGEATQTSMQLGIVQQWVTSAHSRPITFAAEEEGCKNCHDGQTFSETGGGFQPRLGAESTGTGGSTGATGSTETTPPRDWVVATDCRVCHTAAGAQIADDGQVDQIPSIDSARGGLGSVCMACHNGWHPAGARNGELGAPHGSVQTDMLYGVNVVPVQGGGGATQSEVASESPHLKVTNTCAGCHMAGGDSPNHTFKVESYKGCQRKDCHKQDMTQGGTAKEDFDGDGQTEKFQAEVDGLMNTLQSEINRSAGTSSFSSAQGQVVFEGGSVSASDPAYAAAYNYFFVRNDRSRGVHNGPFTIKLLQDSLAALGGTGGTGGGAESTGTGGTGSETTTP